MRLTLAWDPPGATTVPLPPYSQPSVTAVGSHRRVSNPNSSPLSLRPARNCTAFPAHTSDLISLSAACSHHAGLASISSLKSQELSPAACPLHVLFPPLGTLFSQLFPAASPDFNASVSLQRGLLPLTWNPSHPKPLDHVAPFISLTLCITSIEVSCLFLSLLLVSQIPSSSSGAGASASTTLSLQAV